MSRHTVSRSIDCDTALHHEKEAKTMAANPIDLNHDMTQGFNFRKDKMVQIGFITQLKIGDTDLTADITCKDPENNQNDK